MTYSSGGSGSSDQTDNTTTTSTSSDVSAVTVSSSPSQSVYAYWADEGIDNPSYFPNWDLFRVPFSYMKLEKGKEYSYRNNFGTSEGFNVQLWYTDSLDAAYNLQGPLWFRGGQVIRSASEATVEVAQGKYLFVAAFNTGIPEELVDPNGVQAQMSVELLVPAQEGEVIDDDALMLIQQEEEYYSISTIKLKEYFAPLAVAPDLSDNQFGVPGLMYPGEGLTYNEVTGEVDAVIPARPNFKGIITSRDLTFAGFDRDDQHPLNNVRSTLYPVGDELEGDYYVVADKEVTLDRSWGYASESSAFLGDQIVRIRHGDSPGDWEILPSIMGLTSVQKLIAYQTAININSEDLLYPVLSIQTAKAPEESPSNPEGFDGLLSFTDKDTINRLSENYIEQDFTVYPPIE